MIGYDMYLYDSKKRTRFIIEISNWLKLNNITKLVFKIEYNHGPHLRILLHHRIKNLEIYIHHKMNLLKLNSNDENLDYKTYRKIVQRVMLLEKNDSNGLPLKKNYEFEITNVHLKRTKFPNDFYSDQINKTKFLIDHIGEYYQLEKEQKSIFLLKLMMLFPQERHDKLGIFYAYYSFKSHYKGFKTSMSSMNWSPDKLKIINKEINEVSSMEKEFINSGFEKFVKKIEGQRYKLGDDGETIFNDFSVASTTTRQEYTQLFKQNKILIQDDDTLQSYLSRDQELSNYHTQLKNKIKPGLFDSQEFVVGRMMMNWFYSLLPFFSVSVIEKHRLCYIMSCAVENSLKLDGNQMINVLANEYSNYKKGD